ncbi:MAG: Ig-like domain-containing protein, partial [Bacillota bacterium]|nr:Ig-like domain-containing protein [Bacillota bacterium]
TVVEVISGPSHGTAIVLTNRKIKYEPTDDYYGSDEFEYELDGISSAIVSIMVYNKTDFPVARTDVANTDEDEPVDIDVLENDGPDDTVNAEMLDQPISEMEITSVTTPENGSAVIVNGEYITYNPNPDWNGTDEFDYTMSDGVGHTSDAKVTVTVNPVDDPPEAVDDSAKTHEETPVEIYVLDNDTDIDGGPMYVESFEQPEHGIVIRKSDDSNSEDYNVLIYTPDDDYYNRYHGETPKDRFTYMLNGGSDAIVKIKVLNIADQPIAVNDSAKTDEETPVAIEVLENDILPDVLAAEGHETPILEMHVESFTQPEHGIVERDSVDDDILVYTPDINYYNRPSSEPRDEFTYTLNGGSTATVRVKVKNVADQPIANDDEAETDEDTMVYIDVLENDELPDMLTTEAYDEPILSMEILEIVSGPENGTAEIVKGGPVGAEVSTVYDHDYIEYTPDADWNGTDTFEYEITGGDTAIVTVTVIPVDDPPVAVNDWRQTDEETPKSIRVLNNDTDIDGGPMFVDDFTDPSHGTVHRDLIDENILIYTPDTDYYNNPASEPRDSFTYTLNGGSEATVKIKVNNIADQPIANDDEAETLQDKSVVIDVLANDELPDVQVANGYEELILSMEVTRIVTEPLHGTTDIIESVVPSDVTSEWQYNYIKYTPDPNWSGTDSFVYEVNGGSTANVEVVVYPQIMKYNHRSFYGAGAMQSSNDILLDNEFNELTLLAQMTAFNPETVGNLRNDIVEKPYNVNDLLNETFNLKTDSFTTYAETIEGEQPFESLNYVAIEGTILRNNSGNIIGYADNTIIDYNYNATNGVEPPEWHTIELDGVLNNPVVFAQLASVTGGQYTHVRVKDVNSNSFDVFLEEWDVHRATNHHYPELISYIVVEEGIHLLPDGSSIMEVIKTDDEASNEFAVHEFDTIFRERPVVLSQTQTFNDDNQVWMRQKAITDRSVELLKQTDSLNMSSDAYSPRPDPEYTHGEETIGIMAIEKINKYEVTFDANGGNPIPSTQLINEGKKAIEPTDPSKSGWTFSHWKEVTEEVEEYQAEVYPNQDPFDFDTVIWRDTDLLAVYTENPAPRRTRKTYSPDANKDTLETDMNVPVSVTTDELMSNDDNATSFVSVQNPSDGTVELNGDTITFTPDLDFTGTAKFYYTIRNSGKTDNGLVEVIVNQVIIEEETPLGFSNKYLFGDSDGNIRANDFLTKAQLAAMYARILGFNTNGEIPPKYIDTIDDLWYSSYANILFETGIFAEELDKDENRMYMFKPESFVTRAGLASSIVRFYEYVGKEVTPSPSEFTDIEGHSAQSDIEIVAEKGFMEAYSGTFFMPNQFVTRLETVRVLNKVFNIAPKEIPEDIFKDLRKDHEGFEDLGGAVSDLLLTR